MKALIPTVPADVHCAKCNIYQNRVEDAELLNEAFGTEGEWDYRTCFETCEQVRRRELHDCKLNRRG